MQLHHPHEHTGKENSNLHSCEVSFGCQQFWECIENFKLTGDILLNFISQWFCVTFSSRSVHLTDWNAQTFIHLSISKEQIIMSFLERIVSELSHTPFCFFYPCTLPLHNPSYPLCPYSSPPGYYLWLPFKLAQHLAFKKGPSFILKCYMENNLPKVRAEFPAHAWVQNKAQEKRKC